MFSRLQHQEQSYIILLLFLKRKIIVLRLFLVTTYYWLETHVREILSIIFPSSLHSTKYFLYFFLYKTLQQKL